MMETKISRDDSSVPQPAGSGAALIEAAPLRTNVERELVRIWERALQRAPIGIHDDFFDLGGTSIHAALVVAGIEEQFHKRLPVAYIFCSPTIELLAAALLADKTVDRKAFIVPIRTEGEKPALFCIGGGAYWRAVSEHLGPEQPIYDIALAPETVEKVRGPNPMEKFARQLVLAIREKQPQGPYYICGYCQDGILAYEVARQLETIGHPIGLLALIEALNPCPDFRVRAVNSLRRGAIRTLFQLNQLCRLIGTREYSRYARARRGEMKRLLLRVSSRVSSAFGLRAWRSSQIDMQEFIYLKARRCKLKPSSSPTAIFRCADWPILSGGDPYFGWRELLSGRTEIHEIPGVHEEIFREPNVRVLAEKLSACLRNARETQPPAYGAAPGSE
jgi:thioesterase domain-containing protein